MASIPFVACMSHSPYLYYPTEQWEVARQLRAAGGTIAASVPIDSAEENDRKFQRCLDAFGVLRERLDAAQVDVLVIFGDDQGEQFGFQNFPALGVYIGEEFSGFKLSPTIGLPVRGVPRDSRPKNSETWTTTKGHPELARHLMEGLIDGGFDLSFSLELPDEEEGLGHAFMRPSYYIRPEYDIPTVPIFVNCYFPPQPTGRRCYQLGRAIREIIDSWPQDLRVGVIGSGGLWHTPGVPDAILDEEFDGMVMDAVRLGDAKKMARDFDDSRPRTSHISAQGTGMSGGVTSGSGETRNWIAAAATVDGTPGTVIDYVPVYASPCGMGFAYWEDPAPLA